MDGGFAQQTVLNISAEAVRRRSLTEAFEQAGFRVEEATTGVEALQLAARGPYLILLDLCLPDMTGFEVCCRLKSITDTASIPVLHLGFNPTFRPCPEHGEGAADFYVNYPLRPSEVVEAARDLLRVRQAEQLFRGFLETAPDAIVIINEAGAIVRLNAQFEKMFGYRRHELLGQPVEALLPERFRARHAQHRRMYFADPQPRPMGDSQATLVGLRKDGQEFAIGVALSPVPTTLGMLVASAIRDMTHQQRLESELRQRTTELEDADRRKDQFLATLAHELRGPIAAVSQVVGMLSHAGADADALELAIGVVQRQTRHMSRLVEDLSDLRRVGRGDLALQPAPIDVIEVMQTALEANRPLITERRHTLQTELPPGPVHVVGDVTRLVQVISNLLSNAARYTPEGGQIRASIRCEDDMVVLRIRDNGIGIDKQKLTRVFDMFTRLESGKATFASGLGIGLALVRHLVQMHGGSVVACSDGEGLGSEFIVRLSRAPLAEDAPLMQDAPSGSVPAQR